ncbi:hypothetical protein HRI_001345100 [Hibiscus trionum]|uniref:Uncharacterized protein n=1 Tax=Hibiscus trionum TaxID=183268 RepID=A0A9W7LU59_HIBTR|nr:hypothetical protein HRI_001345100 [Hibiscus trionum]
MESSEICGGNEECHSSESGWTMYIGSPGGGGTSEDEEEDDGGYGDETEGGNHEAVVDSDDSMASDASSGPSRFKVDGSEDKKQKLGMDKKEDKDRDKDKDKEGTAPRSGSKLRKTK